MNGCDMRTIGAPAGAAAHEFRSERLGHLGECAREIYPALRKIDVRDGEPVPLREDLRLAYRLGVFDLAFVREALASADLGETGKVFRAAGPAR
jgi:hypothetical protein